MHYGFGGMEGFGGWGGGALLGLTPFFLVIMLWSLFWKGLALWHSAKRGQNWWFIIILVINTAGILEIIYLFAILKLKLGNLFGNKSSVNPVNNNNNQ